MDGDASDRLAITWSLGQNLANTVGRPSTRIIYLSWVYLRPQRPQLGLAHVPAYRPENLHFQWLFCNNSYSLPFNILPSSSASSSGRARLALYLIRSPLTSLSLSLLSLPVLPGSLSLFLLISQTFLPRLIVADYSEFSSSEFLKFCSDKRRHSRESTFL